MASIPLPALGIQSPPQNALGEYLRMAQLQQQNAALKQQTQQQSESFPLEQQQRQQAVEQAKVQTQAMQQQSAEQQALRDLAPKYVKRDESGKVTGYDYDQFFNDAQGKVSPATLQKLQQEHVTTLKNYADLDKDKREKEAGDNKWLFESIEGLKGIADPNQRVAQYRNTVDAARKRGIDISQFPTQPPSNDDLTALEAPLGMHAQLLEDAKTQAQTAKDLRGPEKAAAIQEYNLAQSQGYKGTFEQWTKEQAAAHRAPRNDQTTADAIEAAAQSIASMNPKDLTKLKDIASMRGDQRLLIYNRAKQINPNFSSGEVDRRMKMLDSFQNGKDGQNLQSFGTFLEHAGEASRVANEFRTTSIPLVNTPLNKIRDKFGDASYNQFVAALEPVRKEFEGFLLGGRALYGDDRKAAETILSENSSPAQIQAALKQMGHTVKARYNEVGNRFKNGMGGAKLEDVIGPLSDEALQGAKDIGLDMGGSTTAANKTPPVGATHTAKGSDGKMHYTNDKGQDLGIVQ